MSDHTPPVRLLIAEDEEHLGAILEHFLRGRGYAVTMCRDGKTALGALRDGVYDVALIDIVMPEMDGLEVLRHLQGEPAPPEVIIITGNGTIDTAITAIKLGAYDYISKPYRMAEIDVMVRRAWEKRELTRATAFLRARVAPAMPAAVWSENARMRAALDRLAEVAAFGETVVLHGAAGVGKTHVARWLHGASGRSPDAYAEVTTASAVPGGVAAHLFGYEAGVVPATPARGDGVLQSAARGTVVIDAAALGTADRAALANVLTAREFARVGGTHRIPLEARVVVCDRAPDGRAPELPGVHVTIPELRERPEDLGILAAELVRDAGDGVLRTVASDVMSVLVHYAWPGNVRELRAVIARAAVLAPTPELTAGDVRMVLVWGGGAGGDGERGAQLVDLERQHIETMLVRANWHQGRAAQALGISTKTLYRKMREYGFVRPRKRKLARLRTPSSGTGA